MRSWRRICRLYALLALAGCGSDTNAPKALTAADVAGSWVAVTTLDGSLSPFVSDTTWLTFTVSSATVTGSGTRVLNTFPGVDVTFAGHLEGASLLLERMSPEGVLPRTDSLQLHKEGGRLVGRTWPNLGLPRTFTYAVVLQRP